MTDFLFTSPSFLDGVASIINIAGILPAYNVSSSPAEADRRAYIADVLAMRRDMDVAMSAVKIPCER